MFTIAVVFFCVTVRILRSNSDYSPGNKGTHAKNGAISRMAAQEAAEIFSAITEKILSLSGVFH